MLIIGLVHNLCHGIFFIFIIPPICHKFSDPLATSRPWDPFVDGPIYSGTNSRKFFFVNRGCSLETSFMWQSCSILNMILNIVHRMSEMSVENSFQVVKSMKIKISNLYTILRTFVNYYTNYLSKNHLKKFFEYIVILALKRIFTKIC